jgi:hypothetical protein
VRQFRAGEIVKLNGQGIKIERVFGLTLTQVQFFGRLVNQKGRPLPGSARNGYAAGWFRIADLERTED